MDAETVRLMQDKSREKNWKRWGPYLSERQWATVREDYSEWGNCWDYFPHEHARSRAYRWGEDGLMGWTDRQCRVCFAVALWNGKDPILKERLYGLTGGEGNHGEDVKELYYYLDSTPTHSYAKALYKYPQAEFPYAKLVEENRKRSKHEWEYELTDTGVFDENRYFDVQVEYAKGSEDDTLVRITVSNRGPEAATLHVLPTLWFRNTWSWGCQYEGKGPKPGLRATGVESVEVTHSGLSKMVFEVAPVGGTAPQLLFTENETNGEKVFGTPGARYSKDAFHRYVVNGQADAVNPERKGTKCAAHYVLELKPGESKQIRCRLTPAAERKTAALGKSYDELFGKAVAEADEFYSNRVSQKLDVQGRAVSRQAYAGMLWSKQFYYYVVESWLDGDPGAPKPPASRLGGRNADWRHLFNRDILSMPDKWEYPWYAAWDLAFHMVVFAKVDGEFAKDQLLLLLREWYMHPNGQIPAYEFAFGDVNPPVHAWACWRVYKEGGREDKVFLERAFQKLLLNFTWWVNRKDPSGRNVFGGGFLGLDNIGVFDRSKPLPSGGHLAQADGTAWMAFYCLHMLSMSLELALTNPAYEDIASKFFEHFVAITDAINTLGGTGLWDERDGFYYDQLVINGQVMPLNVRSLVGLMPLLATSVLDAETVEKLPGFKKRMEWFLENKPDLGRHVIRSIDEKTGTGQYLLAITQLQRLSRALGYMLDEDEFLSPYGVRSLSRVHKDRPYRVRLGNDEYTVSYEPGDSQTGVFGGNSNWRGPVWFPINVLLVQALERFHHFYGDGLKVQCPAASGKVKDLHEVAMELRQRLTRLFTADPATGRRACHGEDARYANDAHFKDLVLFHEYFDGDSGRGLGASHQTGWTGLVATLLDEMARSDEEESIYLSLREKQLLADRQAAARATVAKSAAVRASVVKAAGGKAAPKAAVAKSVATKPVTKKVAGKAKPTATKAKKRK
jgi:hypothetical protein